ncbi:hypothetical protein O7607_01780 [Micromonospora sp. WMMA1949]|uniref:hypothetical protein n=1 Tax=unclassified Micromonospora TaxID=2617518 RepID=UPI0022B610F2|nr:MULTISPECIES: hypothetical protein [unclassified Micromonospora]MCZ7424450.1 hypothetical protein [Micromonospora sp. WMMA1949]WBC09081.1 hypothetical protein O7604_28325 [Micromonospora sp. WMMA1947]
MNRIPSTVLAGLLALTAVVPVTAGAPVAAAPALAAADAAPALAAADAAPVRPAVAENEVLSVHGAGPFRIGARLDRLVAAGLIDWTAPGCPGIVHAGVTGSWAGAIMLTFRAGRLVSVGTATAPPRSPAGGAVGMSFAELERIYGPRGRMIRNDAGDAEAYLVRFGSRVELFSDHPIRPGVGFYAAGPASYVERSFRQGCC